MAGNIQEKLYPPTIGGSIPAFYDNGGTATIAVPFSMNKAVSKSEISGFRLKIKTVQGNNLIAILKSNEVDNSITNRVVTFDADSEVLNKLKIGQYVKVQLAYADNSLSQTVGYFSTVGVTKYTSKPNIYILGFNNIENDPNSVPVFMSSCTGVYETTEDKTERPYSYNFSLFDSEQNLIETTGWLLHNTSINNVATESLQLLESTDTYTFKSALTNNADYYIQYGVRTINNLEVFSRLYHCEESTPETTTLKVNLIAENVFEEGFIRLSLKLNPDYANESLGDPVSIEIQRAEKTDGFSTWQSLIKFYFTSYEQALKKVLFEDLTIEQGMTYLYCFRQYTANGVCSDRSLSNMVEADFEDMFLWDGEKQLKIRFNPKVSSFKTSRLETKMDTIGSRYPFIFRNGTVQYKEFPISGLISYLADNNERFISHTEDLNIVLPSYGLQNKILDTYRALTQEEFNATENGTTLYFKVGNKGAWSQIVKDENTTMINITYYTKEEIEVQSARESTPTERELYKNSQTLDSIAYNMRAERIFKLKLLEWLGDGKIKMFKSPAEGNYLVRLMNISLSPEDKLGRMLHSFNATAYEVEELNYENLINLGFIRPMDEKIRTIEIKSVLFRDIIEADYSNRGFSANRSIKINDNTIADYMYIGPSPNVQGGSTFFVRLGKDTEEARVLVQPGFIIQSINAQLPDVYFRPSDNKEILYTLFNTDQSVELNNFQIDRTMVFDLVADTLLTYKYEIEESITGDFYNIETIYVKNKIETIVGPTSKYFQVHRDSVQNLATEEVLRYYVLNFKRKDTVELYYDNTVVKDFSGNPVTEYSNLCIYKIYTDINKTNYSFYYSTNGYSLTRVNQLIDDNFFTEISLTDSEGVTYNLINDVPDFSSNHLYTNITLNYGVYLECAYQVRMIDFNAGG